MKLVNWNVDWAAAHWRTYEILNRINQHSPEIVCLTETHSRIAPGRAPDLLLFLAFRRGIPWEIGRTIP